MYIIPLEIARVREMGVEPVSNEPNALFAELIDKFERALIEGGTSPEYAAVAVGTYRGAASNETNGWRPIETCPKDGTPFLATLRIFNAKTKEFMHHDTQVVWVDDETGELHPDCYFGWDLADCEFWMPIPPLPTREPEGR